MSSHPQYHLVTYVSGDVAGKRDILEWRDAFRRPRAEELIDAYTSVYFFPEDLRAYAMANAGSVAGYRGPHHARGLHWDVDAEGNLEAARESTIRLVHTLHEAWDVTPESLLIFFSGAKGFHVLAWDCFDVEPSADVHAIVSQMAWKIAGEIPHVDFAVYDVARIWRLPGSIHSRTQCRKTRLSVEELESLSAERIQKMALEQRPPMLAPVRCVSSKLQALFNGLNATRKEKPVVIPAPSIPRTMRKDQKICIQNLMEGVGEGGRNATALRLADHWKKEGFTPDFVASIMQTWNLRNHPPLQSEEIDAICASSEKGKYDFGCKDEILKAACAESCKWKRKQAASKLLTMADAGLRYIQRCKQGESVKIGAPNVDEAMRGLTPGMVCGFYGKTGVGKTAWLINVLRHVCKFQNRRALLLEIEMPAADVFERASQLILRKSGQVIENLAKLGKLNVAEIDNEYGNVLIADTDAIDLDQLEEFIRLAQSTGPLDLVALDYLGRMEGGAGSAYERVSRLALGLKSVAKRTDVPILFLGQLSRAATDIYQRVTLGMLRDSGVQEEACDYVLGAWRVPTGEPERDLFNLEVLKNRRGRFGAQTVYDFLMATCELFPKDVVEREPKEAPNG